MLTLLWLAYPLAALKAMLEDWFAMARRSAVLEMLETAIVYEVASKRTIKLDARKSPD